MAPRLPTEKASLSQEYQLARRSVRLWPIAGETEEDIWGNVGDFIHDVLKVPHGDVKQDDIVAVERVRGEVMVEGIIDELDFACITETWFKGGRDLTANI